MPKTNKDFFSGKEVLGIAAYISLVHGFSTGIAAAVLGGSFLESAAISSMGLFSSIGLVTKIVPQEKNCPPPTRLQKLSMISIFNLGSVIIGSLEAKLLFGIALSAQPLIHNTISIPLTFGLLNCIYFILNKSDPKIECNNQDMDNSPLVPHSY